MSLCDLYPRLLLFASVVVPSWASNKHHYVCCRPVCVLFSRPDRRGRNRFSKLPMNHPLPPAPPLLCFPAPELSMGRQEAFTIFRRDHEDSVTIEDNKALLKQRSVPEVHELCRGGIRVVQDGQCNRRCSFCDALPGTTPLCPYRFAEAKALGEQVNGTRSRVSEYGPPQLHAHHSAEPKVTTGGSSRVRSPPPSPSKTCHLPFSNLNVCHLAQTNADYYNTGCFS